MPNNPTQAIMAARGSNSCQPVNSLPVELLTTIFAFAQDYYHKKDCAYAWIRILHVCSHWYKVGTMAPLLWSTITATSGMDMECAREMLKRSGTTILNVNIRNMAFTFSTPNPSRSFAVAGEILNQMHRIRSLRTCFESGDNKLVPRLKEASMLKSLELDFINSSKRDVSSLFPFPATLYNLETLKFQVFKLPPGVLHAPNLRVLHISCDWYRAEQHHQKAKDIIDSIRGMPLLEDLHLHRAFPSSRVSARERPPLAPPLDLPNLKVFSLSDRSNTVYRVLECLNVPVTATLDLQIEPISCAAMDSAELSPLRRILYVTESFRGREIVKHRPFHTLTIKNPYTGYPRLQFIGCAHAGNCVDDATGACSLKSFEVAFRATEWNEREWNRKGVDEVLDLLSVQDVKVLNLHGISIYASLKWRLREHPDIKLPPLPEAGMYHLGASSQADQLLGLGPNLQRAFPSLQTVSMAYYDHSSGRK